LERWRCGPVAGEARWLLVRRCWASQAEMERINAEQVRARETVATWTRGERRGRAEELRRAAWAKEALGGKLGRR
jgi:hypothetical protein